MTRQLWQVGIREVFAVGSFMVGPLREQRLCGRDRRR